MVLNAMPLIPVRRKPSPWRTATRFVAILVVLLISIGFMVDFFSGLEVLRSSRSWTAWLVGIGAFGVLYLLAEGAGEWINARDKVTHPLWKRVWHLALLLGMIVLIAIAAGEIVRMTQ